MNIEFMDVRSQNKTISLWFITLLIFFVITQQVYAADEQQWIQVPQANYADVLEMIAFRAKANYEEIYSWQGRMNILETSHYYGQNAAEKSFAVDINSIARDSQHICEIATTTADFALDPRNGKLYSNVEPNVKYKAIDLDQFVPVRKNTSCPRTKTILTAERYIWCMPDKKFAPNLRSLPVQKMVFIESSQNKNVKGFVRDPRIFFESSGEDGKKLWETLLRIRSNIEERINTRVAGYPHIEISSLNTDKGIRYHILTTWKGGENYAIKYIRSLLEVDESVGFNAIKTETTNPDGVKTVSKQYSYENFNGIYVPKTVRKEINNNKGEPTFSSEITIETISINKPLPEDTFSIKKLGVEEDTIVSDNIKKAEFRFSKGNLVPISEPNNPPK